MMPKDVHTYATRHYHNMMIYQIIYPKFYYSYIEIPIIYILMQSHLPFFPPRNYERRKFNTSPQIALKLNASRDCGHGHFTFIYQIERAYNQKVSISSSYM